ncbi:MAG TPA: O-methyltransferase [Acidimicrobiales bacterium]
MSQTTWTNVDRNLIDLLEPPDEVLDATLEASRAAGLPSISVAPNQGKMLHILARAQHARNILEIGTLGGYSTIWLARALPPEGRLVTLELEDRHARVAHANLVSAGVDGQVEIRVGPAAAGLEALVDEGAGPFDLVFIDADKARYPEYFTWSLRLTRPGSLIVADNVVRNGAVIDTASTDPDVVGIRQFLEQVGADRRVAATVIQTVGLKGYDGFALALVLEAP